MLLKRNHHFMAIQQKPRWKHILQSGNTWYLSCFMLLGLRIHRICWDHEEEALIFEGSGCIFNCYVGKTDLEGGMGQRPPS
jgi:hypothetical protein